MYEVIDDAFIKRTIGNYDALSKEIHEEMQRTLKELSGETNELHENDLIEAASMPGRECETGLGGGGTQRDLYSVYGRYKELERVQKKDALKYIMELTSRQETMNRIMTCVRVLPLQEKQIIMCFYGPGQYYNKGIVEIPIEFGISTTTAKRISRRALKHIKELYYLKCSQTELYRYDFETRTLRNYY